MQYLVIESDDDSSPSTAVEKLQNEICDYLQIGWKLQGGVCVTHCPVDHNRFAGEDFYMAFQAITHDGDGPLPE